MQVNRNTHLNSDSPSKFDSEDGPDLELGYVPGAGDLFDADFSGDLPIKLPGNRRRRDGEKKTASKASELSPFGKLLFGANKLEKKNGLAGGACLAVETEGQEHENSSAYIQSNIMRRRCAESYETEVAWKESSGILEIGNGLQGTVSLGMAAPVSLSGSVQGLVQYRCLSPDGSAFSVPLTAKLLKSMPVGQEVELIGSGNFTLGAHYQVPTWAAGVSVSGGGSKDYSLMVQRMPGDIAYVSFCSNDERRLEVAAIASAETSVLGQIPKAGEGVLKYILEKTTGKEDLLETAKSYCRANAGFSAGAEFNHEEALGFQFDLSNSRACEAYEQIFQSLSFESCIDFAKEGTAGVLFGKKQAEEAEFCASADLSLGDEKVFLYEALSASKDTHISTKHRKINLKDRKFEQTFETYFSGSKSVSWQSVGVAEEGVHDEKNYYHLVFKGKDKVTEAKEVEDFVSFARAVGIKMANPSKKMPQMSYLTKLFSDADDSEICVDMYFTDRGIVKIDNATKSECIAAYMACMNKYSGDESKIKDASLLDRYRELQSSWFLNRWWNDVEIRELKLEYEFRNPGRNIDRDMDLLTEAEEFAERLEGLNEEKDPDSVDEFFTNLGWEIGFDYMKTLAAMAFIAGQDETIIHELSMRGGDIKLASIDEGEIRHPERGLGEYLP